MWTHFNVNFHILTYLLTPWSRVLLEKLTCSAARQEILRSFGTRRFITVLTSTCHLYLSWAKSIQSPQPPPTSWRSILILSSHLRYFPHTLLILFNFTRDSKEQKYLKSSNLNRNDEGSTICYTCLYSSVIIHFNTSNNRVPCTHSRLKSK